MLRLPSILGRTGSKYFSKKTEYNGVTYDSQKEAEYASYLDIQAKLKKIKKYERQVSIPLTVNGKLICRYICDFLVYHIDGSMEYIEIKSKYTQKLPVYRLKRKLLEAIIFTKENKNKYTVLT